MAAALRHPVAPPPARRRRSPRRRPVRSRAARAEQFYLPSPVDNSRLVKVADPCERRSYTRMVAMSLLLAFAILAAAYQRFAFIRAGYRTEELKSQREQLLEANRLLRLEEASLRDPERVDSIARRQLGMEPPVPGQVVHLENQAPEAGGAVVARARIPW